MEFLKYQKLPTRFQEEIVKKAQAEQKSDPADFPRRPSRKSRDARPSPAEGRASRHLVPFLPWSSPTG